MKRTLIFGLTILSTIVISNGAPLSDREKVIHVLDRLGFGARPGDIERVEKMGLEKYIRQQMQPDRIDDTAVEKKLAAFSTLTMSAEDLAESFRAEMRQVNELNRARNQTNAPAASPPPMRPPIQDRISKIIRAVESERQFYEALVDFWSNHFNIDVRKGPCRVTKTVDDREVIRPHVWGTFRDLLGASAKSPAMLTYLDNAQSSAERMVSPMEQRMRQRFRGQAGLPDDPDEKPTNQPRRMGGLNENYGREILELHTLGVDGGYTQNDVTEVARCFTGWGLNPMTGKFSFTPFRHDNGPKTVLGHTLPANGGIKDGEKVLDIIAKHPSTAKHIAFKLCQRFVADDPPVALVDRVAKVFLNTDGDLPKVYEAIIFSHEFFSREAYRAKIKSPFEFAVSSIRAVGGSITVATGMQHNLRMAAETGMAAGRGLDRFAANRRKTINMHIIELGQPLFAYAAPTGYPEDSRKWVSTGALVSRLNFALALTEQSVANVSFQPQTILSRVDIDQADAVLDRLSQFLLGGQMTEATRATITKEAIGDKDGHTTVNTAKLAALTLGSPEFQRR
jgi:uncharacterized protein (DUF1800 family)